jgi:8-oxo-dGTP diphosphatase
MSLFLVRHAKAGERSRWTGPDQARPLSGKGRAQADALARLLADRVRGRILSSPYLRCVQTVEPLARKVGLAVEPTDALAEGRPFEPVLALVAGVPDGSVLCSHGDLVPDVIEALRRRGATIAGAVDWRKGVTWVLDREGDAVVRAHALAPPEE